MLKANWASSASLFLSLSMPFPRCSLLPTVRSKRTTEENDNTEGPQKTHTRKEGRKRKLPPRKKKRSPSNLHASAQTSGLTVHTPPPPQNDSLAGAVPETTPGTFPGTFPGAFPAERGDRQERGAGYPAGGYAEDSYQLGAGVGEGGGGGVDGHVVHRRRRSSETFVTEGGAMP